MKIMLLFILAVLATAQISAQTTARDWSKSDCKGTMHHLFAELDSGNVIILEFVMMNCAPCVTAAKGMTTVVGQYDESHPGKVRMYSIGYSNNYTCGDMSNWQKTTGLSHLIFTEGGDDVQYYGGMGMPTVVIVGGQSHKIYYNNLGYKPADNTQLKQAIDQAFSELVTDVRERPTSVDCKIFPNPVRTELSLSFEPGVADRLIISDMTGRELIRQQIGAVDHTAMVNTQALTDGVYCVRLLHRGSIVKNQIFTVQSR